MDIMKLIIAPVTKISLSSWFLARETLGQ